MKPRNCLALVVTSVLAIGCAAARAQDGQGNAPAPAPQQPPVQTGTAEPQRGDRGRRDDEMRVVIETRILDGEQRLADAEAHVAKLKRDGLLDAHPDMVAAQEQVARGRAYVEMMRKRLDQIAADGPRPDRSGPDGRGDDGMRRRAMGGMGRDDDRGPGDRGAMRGPGPSVEERLAQIERAVHEMREMFERHGVPQDARERGEREMRERRGDGPPPGDERGGRRAWRADGFDGRPGEAQGPDQRPDGPGRPPVPRPPIAQPPGARGEVTGVQWGAGADDARRQLDAARTEMESHMKQMHDQMEAQMRAAQTQMEELKKQLADTQTALKAAQAELETLRAKK